MRIWYWCGSLKERDHFENQGVNENVSIIMDVQEIFSGPWTELKGGIGGLL